MGRPKKAVKAKRGRPPGSKNKPIDTDRAIDLQVPAAAPKRRGRPPKNRVAESEKVAAGLAAVAAGEKPGVPAGPVNAAAVVSSAAGAPVEIVTPAGVNLPAEVTDEHAERQSPGTATGRLQRVWIAEKNVCKAEEKLRDREAALEKAKRAAKEAEAERDELIVKLRQCVRGIDDAAQLPLPFESVPAVPAISGMAPASPKRAAPEKAPKPEVPAASAAVRANPPDVDISTPAGKALARTGLDALIDEATGYQDARPADAVAQGLAKNLAEAGAVTIPPGIDAMAVSPLAKIGLARAGFATPAAVVDAAGGEVTGVSRMLTDRHGFAVADAFAVEMCIMQNATAPAPVAETPAAQVHDGPQFVPDAAAIDGDATDDDKDAVSEPDEFEIGDDEESGMLDGPPGVVVFRCVACPHNESFPPDGAELAAAAKNWTGVEARGAGYDGTCPNCMKHGTAVRCTACHKVGKTCNVRHAMSHGAWGRVNYHVETTSFRGLCKACEEAKSAAAPKPVAAAV